MAGFQEPAVVCVYGPSGAGKTVDALYTFPGALFLAAPGALKPAVNVVGLERVLYAEARTIQDATAALKKARGTTQAIVVDDFTFLAEKTFSDLEKSLSGFKLFGRVRDLLLEFRETARWAGVHVLLNAHERPAHTDNITGTMVRGGPKLPGRMPEELPAACDLVLRAVEERGRLGWPYAYQCRPDGQFLTKDRHGVADLDRASGRAPLNVGEILRSAGYQIPRVHAWQEAIVAQIASAIAAFPPDAAQLATGLRQAFAELAGKYGALPARWTIRDAVDRAALRRMRTPENLMQGYF